jgi:D-alanyl-D-alanine carboxypeptidase
VPPGSAVPSSKVGASPSPIPLLAALPTGKLDAASAKRLQAVLDLLVKGGQPDAIAAVITADGQWSGASGVDGPKGRAADPADEFNAASVSKVILAALVLRLAQDGRMDLDAPLSSYLGDLPVNANGATVRQALGMRSGIGKTPSDLLEEAHADCGRVWTRTEVLRSIPAPHAAPGASIEDSNPTYKLLAYAAEHVTGTPLETAYQDLVFAPIGVKRILLQVPTRPTPKPWALPIAGHENNLDLRVYGTGGTLPCISLSTFSFQNAVASDAPNLARLVWGLFSGKLLDRDSLVAMTTVQAADSPDDPDFLGLGIERIPDFYFSGLAYASGGSQAGYKSFLAILPERQIVAALFINDDQADAQAATRELINALGN